MLHSYMTGCGNKKNQGRFQTATIRERAWRIPASCARAVLLSRLSPWYQIRPQRTHYGGFLVFFAHRCCHVLDEKETLAQIGLVDKFVAGVGDGVHRPKLDLPRFIYQQGKRRVSIVLFKAFNEVQMLTITGRLGTRAEENMRAMNKERQDQLVST